MEYKRTKKTEVKKEDLKKTDPMAVKPYTIEFILVCVIFGILLQIFK